MQKEEYQILIKDIKALLQNICKDDRVKYHIEPVVKSAKNLALKFNADVQVVEIASYLHDVTKITGDRKKHHITGAKYAENLLYMELLCMILYLSTFVSSQNLRNQVLGNIVFLLLDILLVDVVYLYRYFEM